MSPKALGQLTQIRQDPVKAESILQDLFSTRKQLNVALGMLADDIQTAARVAPASWGVSLFRNRLCLNVGGLAVLQFLDGCMRFVATGRQLSELPKATRKLLDYSQPYSFISDATEWDLYYEDLKSFDAFFSAHADVVERSAQKRKICFWPKAHSPSIPKLLRRRGYDVPDPDYRVAGDVAYGARRTLEDLDEMDHVTVEGKRFMRTHLARERNGMLVRRKKEDVLRKTGSLACEVCEFDFAKQYGSIGYDFAEIHHLTPLASSRQSRRVSLKDLAVVCSNCHRMLHKGRPVFTLKELKRRMRRGR